MANRFNFDAFSIAINKSIRTSFKYVKVATFTYKKIFGAPPTGEAYVEIHKGIRNGDGQEFSYPIIKIGDKELRLSPKSFLEEGDNVDISTIKAEILIKDGFDPSLIKSHPEWQENGTVISRWDGKAL